MTAMKVNNYYNLSTFASSILGATHKSLKLIGILNYDNAVKLENIDALNKQIYPYLPHGTPRNHTQYTYYHFEKGGRTIVLAEYWIVPDSLTEVSGETYIITLKNATSSEVTALRDTLRLIGADFTIE